MAIDPSIPLGFKSPDPSQQFNPLVAQSNATQAANQLISFQQNQQQLRARQAIGQAQQAATDPNTGVVDQGKFRALVAADPNAALGAQAADSTSMEQQQQGLSNEAQTLKNQGQKIGFLAGLAAPLAADPNVTKAKVQDTIQHAVNFGLVDAPTAQQMLNSIPEDSVGVRQSLAGFLKAQMGPTPEYEHIYGTPSSINQGTKIVNGTVGPADQGGRFNGSTSTPLGLSPSELSSQQPGVGPNGQPTVIPLAGRLGAEGMGNLVNPGNTQSLNQGGKPTVPPQWSQPGSGGYPATQPAQPVDSNGSGPSGGQAETVPTTPQSIVTGLAPGTKTSLETYGSDAGRDLLAAQHDAANFSARQYGAQTALGALVKLGPTGTGPGTEGRNALVSYATSLGFTAPSDQTKAYDEASKYLTQNAMAQPGATGSDSRLSTALSGNASTHISNLAAQDVVRANIALDRQKQGALQAFQQSGQTPDKWPSFAANWSSKVDPRAYAFDLLTPQKRTAVMSTMSPQQKATFYSQVQQAVQQGLVQPPTAPQNASPPQVPTQ